jgi:hypothetical protein
MSRPKESHRRLWQLLVVTSLLLPIVGAGLFYGWHSVQIWGRTQRRERWLREQEQEVVRQIQAGRPGSTGPDQKAWLGQDHAVFDRGWAAWRVHSFHDDPDHGNSWSGVGDIALLIDDTGKVSYSRFHFCDGTVPWGLGVPPAAPPSRPASAEAFLDLFKPGTWTTDRTAVESAIPSPPRLR